MYAFTSTGYRAINDPSQAAPGEQVAENLPEWLIYPNFDSVVSAAIEGVQAWIDSVAAQNGYDSALSCASYASSGVEIYRNDAAAIIAWRDAVWLAANAWRNGLGGQLPSPLPTIDEVISQLPKPQNYGWTVHGDGASSETSQQS